MSYTEISTLEQLKKENVFQMRSPREAQRRATWLTSRKQREASPRLRNGRWPPPTLTRADKDQDKDEPLGRAHFQALESESKKKNRQRSSSLNRNLAITYDDCNDTVALVKCIPWTLDICHFWVHQCSVTVGLSVAIHLNTAFHFVTTTTIVDATEAPRRSLALN